MAPHRGPRLAPDRSADWDRDGFFVMRGFADADVGRRLHERVVEICRAADGQLVHQGSILLGEPNLADVVDEAAPAEARIAKVFRLHRDPVFRAFVESPELLDVGRSILGPRIDCFLSQYIFKNAGAWGQPWHQDSYYFPFDRGPQVGLWLAVTEANLDNGCLWVVPGSHREPVHDHVPDRRRGSLYGYVEIVDHDTATAVPVTMAPGDLLVFHSHLMHRSTDNTSSSLRAAMVYHLAVHGTVDTSGDQSPVNDWLCLPDRDDDAPVATRLPA